MMCFEEVNPKELTETEKLILELLTFNPLAFLGPSTEDIDREIDNFLARARGTR